MKPIRIELPTEFDVGSVNSYLFTEPEPVLVDCGVGTEASWEALQASLAQHDLTPADIRRVIVTHPHVDHFGLAARIADLSGGQVWIADMGAKWLIDPKKHFGLRAEYYRDEFLIQAGIPAEMQQLVLGYFIQIAAKVAPVPAACIQTFGLEDCLEMGGTSWQVLHMPGHARNQTCFYQPESQLFLSADMLLPKTPTPIVERPYPNQPRQPSLPVYMESLARCEALDIDTVYPGHGDPFRNHRQLIQKQRERIHKRKAEALSLIQQGHHTAYALMDKMYAHYPAGFRFAGLWMLIGYLDLLQGEGAISQKTVAGVWQYYVNE